MQWAEQNNATDCHSRIFPLSQVNESLRKCLRKCFHFAQCRRALWLANKWQVTGHPPPAAIARRCPLSLGHATSIAPHHRPLHYTHTLCTYSRTHSLEECDGATSTLPFTALLAPAQRLRRAKTLSCCKLNSLILLTNKERLFLENSEDPCRNKNG